MKSIFFIMLFLAGCATRSHHINHIVFVELQDISQVSEIIEDSNERLASIPVVKNYFCGTHVSSGRDTVKTDYDVGIYFAFDSLEDYETYVNHPGHISFVNDWKPKLKSLRVYDISSNKLPSE